MCVQALFMMFVRWWFIQVLSCCVVQLMILDGVMSVWLWVNFVSFAFSRCSAEAACSVKVISINWLSMGSSLALTNLFGSVGWRRVTNRGEMNCSCA